MTHTYRPRRIETPERLDLDGPEPLFRPLWTESAKSVLHLLLTGTPEAPPGARLAPTPHDGDPLLGQLREGRGDPLHAFLRWQREVGDIVRLRLAGVTAHLVSNPRDVKQVLQSRARHYIRPMQGRRNLANVLGNGLLVSEGSFWLRAAPDRRSPPSTSRAIDAFGERMVAAADDLAGEWEARAERGEPFDASRDMMRLTLRVVQETLLGTAPSADADRIGEAVSFLLERRQPPLRPRAQPAASASRPPSNLRFRESLSVLDGAVARMIADRRATPGQRRICSPCSSRRATRRPAKAWTTGSSATR